MAKSQTIITRKVRSFMVVIPLCVPKIRFCDIGGEVHRELDVILWHRGAQSRDGTARPCSGNDESSNHYSRRHMCLESGAGALHRIRSCGPGTPGGSSQ